LIAVDLDSTIAKQISASAKDLEDLLASDVVAYTGPIHPAIFQRFRNFIEGVKASSKRTENTLSIVLRTGGGSAETADRFVTVIRKHYKSINFVVPDYAMSAGTIFCMSGDKIFMDYASSLGPIDPQVMAPDNSGWIPALGYLDKVAEITNKTDLSPADVVFLRSLDLAKLALYEQARDLSIDLLKEWLVRYKFKDWNEHRTTNPGTPVTQEEKAARAAEIAEALANHRKWFSHGRSLNVDKLKELRIEIDDYSDNDALGDKIRGYSDMLSAYNDRMNRTFHLHSCNQEVF
jgi:Serine dehydrogenase proteinase